MDILNNTDFDVIDFQKEVIEQSYQKPVLVDFWAPWCGPCKMISPLLEKAYKTMGGQFVLAKVNVDNNQALANTYQVRGIPACKLFIEGAVVDEFTGVIPERALMDFLEKYVTNDRKIAIRDANQMIADGNVAAGVEQLSALLAEQDDPAIRLSLAKAEMKRDPAKAGEWLSGIYEDSPQYLEATNLRALLTLIEAGQQPDKLPEDKVKPLLVAAAAAVAREDMETALVQLIDSIMQHKAYADELARQSCIAIFAWLGREHPLTKKYRRRFDMSLY